MRGTLWVGREGKLVEFSEAPSPGRVVQNDGARYVVVSVGWFLNWDASVAGCGLHHGAHAYAVAA